MTFKEGYRLEKVYFENIYTLLNMLKSVDKNNVDINTVKELLDNAIADNESIILIYKNLGELYSEVADNYSKLLADLEALKENLESWKDEINEKIDDLNNYIMSLIRDIEQRLDSLEQRMSDAEEAIDSLEDRMDTAEADIDALEGRMDTAEDDIDALEGRMDTAEDDIDNLEGRMDSAEDDIDNLETNKQDKLTAGDGIVIDSNNEISVDETVVQPKLTEGFGIDIDSNNEIKVDTAQVQEKLIAGQNITLTPDTTDPTKTVIDAQGGSSYTAGTAIDIDANNKINYVFPKLIIGTGVRQIKSTTFNLYELSGQYPLMCGAKSADIALTKSEIEDMLNEYGVLFIFISNSNVQTVIPSNGDTMSVFVKMSLQVVDNNSLSIFGSSGFGQFVYTERKPQGSGVKFTHGDYPLIEITDELRRLLDVMNKNNLSSITLRINFTYSVYFDGKIISELTSVSDPDIANLSNYKVIITGRY